MSYRPKGKHVQIDSKDPESLGRCDYTGSIFNRSDLVKQMEWRGNALVWTGFYVGRPFADVPNEQLRPPMLPPDPVPIINPRPKQPTIVTWAIGNSVPWSEIDVFSWASWEGVSDGVICLPEPQRYDALTKAFFGVGNS